MPIIDGFIDRSHSILPEDGVAAFILPAHVFSTAGRVMQWNERFALDVKTIPRSLFSRISMPLVWAKFIKTQRRTMIGLMLFAEQNAVENMPKAVRSEEHTSELQSLMRISYAVFRLYKKKQTT